LIKLTALTINDLKRSIPSHVAARARLCSPALSSFSMGPDGIVLQFWTASAGSRNSWIQTVQLFDWQLVPELVELQETNAGWDKVKAEVPEIMDLLNVKVHCNCPAFLWYGSQYQLTQLDTSMFDESIYPYVRDPSLQNTVCKHLAAAFDQFFIPGTRIRSPEEKKTLPQEISAPKDYSTWDTSNSTWSNPNLEQTITRTDQLPQPQHVNVQPDLEKEWYW
jgi:hypothetical protein